MYRWIHHKGSKWWNYFDRRRGCGGIVIKGEDGMYQAASPTTKKIKGIWMHNPWGSFGTLAEAKRKVENVVSERVKV